MYHNVTKFRRLCDLFCPPIFAWLRDNWTFMCRVWINMISSVWVIKRYHICIMCNGSASCLMSVNSTSFCCLDVCICSSSANPSCATVCQFLFSDIFRVCIYTSVSSSSLVVTGFSSLTHAYQRTCDYNFSCAKTVEGNIDCQRQLPILKKC